MLGMRRGVDCLMSVKYSLVTLPFKCLYLAAFSVFPRLFMRVAEGHTGGISCHAEFLRRMVIQPNAVCATNVELNTPLTPVTGFPKISKSLNCYFALSSFFLFQK